MADTATSASARNATSASSNAAHAATAAGTDRRESPQAAEATKAIDASRQAGVVNPGELSKEVAKSYAQDPKNGAALHAAVNEQLSERDQASLDDHLSATLGSVAAAGTASAVSNSPTPPQGLTTDQFAQTSKTVAAKAQEMGLGNDIVAQGSRVARTASPASDLDIGIRVSPDKFDNFLQTESRLSSVNPGSAKEKTLQYSQENGIIQRGEARLTQTGKALESQLGMDVDLSVVRKGGGFDQGPSTPMRTPPSAVSGTARAAGQGAVLGAAADATMTTYGALKDGHISGEEAKDIVANSARGAVVGGAYSVTDRGFVKLADRTTGAAIERSVANTATRLGAADAGALSAATRTVATRLGGAGAAGAVISAGMSIYDNREGLAQGDSQAIGRVVGDTAVGASAALSGAAAGAVAGSFVPVVGTAVGAVVGLGVGLVADHVMRAGGVDKAIGQAVASGVDAAKSAASTVARWLGW
jgi:hypothetical protein